MYCPKCGEPQGRNANSCASCGYIMPPSILPAANMAGILPVNTSGWAIAAGYLGLLAVLGLPAPFALVCGVIALRAIRRDGLRGHVRAWLGIVMGAGCSVLYLLIIVGSAMHK